MKPATIIFLLFLSIGFSQQARIKEPIDQDQETSNGELESLDEAPSQDQEIPYGELENPDQDQEAPYGAPESLDEDQDIPLRKQDQSSTQDKKGSRKSSPHIQQESQQEVLGAVSLGKAMSVYVNYTLTGNEVAFTTWFDNPGHIEYWNDYKCLAIVVGTPLLSEDDHLHSRCGFLPTESGASNGLACINQMPLDPCKEDLTVANDCGSDVDVVPLVLHLSEIAYRGRNEIQTTKFEITDKSKSNAEWFKRISSRSMLVAYTYRTGFISYKQLLQCTNTDMKNATIRDLRKYPLKKGIYNYTGLSSFTVSIQANVSLILGTIAIALASIFVF